MSFLCHSQLARGHQVIFNIRAVWTRLAISPTHLFTQDLTVYVSSSLCSKDLFENFKTYGLQGVFFPIVNCLYSVSCCEQCAMPLAGSCSRPENLIHQFILVHPQHLVEAKLLKIHVDLINCLWPLLSWWMICWQIFAIIPIKWPCLRKRDGQNWDRHILLHFLFKKFSHPLETHPV